MQRAGFFLWIVICAVLVFDIGNACVRAQDSSDRIKTQEVDIVNSSGATVFQIVDEPEGPEINFSDPNGRMRLGVGATNDGGESIFFDANDNDTATFGGIDGKDGLTDSLGFMPLGPAKVGLVADSTYGQLTFADNAGKEREAISYDASQDISFFATMAAKDQKAMYGVIYGKFAHVMLDDPQAKPRGDFGVETNDDAYFAVADKAGNVPWQKAFKPDGSLTTISGEDSGTSRGAESGIGSAIRQNRSP